MGKNSISISIPQSLLMKGSNEADFRILSAHQILTTDKPNSNLTLSLSPLTPRFCVLGQEDRLGNGRLFTTAFYQKHFNNSYLFVSIYANAGSLRNYVEIKHGERRMKKLLLLLQEEWASIIKRSRSRAALGEGFPTKMNG